MIFIFTVCSVLRIPPFNFTVRCTQLRRIKAKKAQIDLPLLAAALPTWLPCTRVTAKSQQAWSMEGKNGAANVSRRVPLWSSLAPDASPSPTHLTTTTIQDPASRRTVHKRYKSTPAPDCKFTPLLRQYGDRNLRLCRQNKKGRNCCRSLKATAPHSSPS